MDKLVGNFKKLPIAAKKELANAFVKTASTIQRHAKLEVPVKTGTLQKHIFIFPSGIGSGMVSATSKYAAAVEFGSKPHIIRARTAKVLSTGKGGIIFGKTVRHPGTRPNPFMRRAATKSEKDIEKIMRDAGAAITKIIN